MPRIWLKRKRGAIRDPGRCPAAPRRETSAAERRVNLWELGRRRKTSGEVGTSVVEEKEVFE